jgi:hypothetical protein
MYVIFLEQVKKTFESFLSHTFVQPFNFTNLKRQDVNISQVNQPLRFAFFNSIYAPVLSCSPKLDQDKLWLNLQDLGFSQFDFG